MTSTEAQLRGAIVVSMEDQLIKLREFAEAVASDPAVSGATLARATALATAAEATTQKVVAWMQFLEIPTQTQT